MQIEIKNLYLILIYYDFRSLRENRNLSTNKVKKQS